MKLFISQPMNGKTKEVIKKEREEAISKIKSILGESDIEVIDSFIEDAPENANGLWYLGKSIELLSEADVAYFVSGWDSTRGCIIEHKCCEEYGVKIIGENPDTKLSSNGIAQIIQ